MSQLQKSSTPSVKGSTRARTVQDHTACGNGGSGKDPPKSDAESSAAEWQPLSEEFSDNVDTHTSDGRSFFHRAPSTNGPSSGTSGIHPGILNALYAASMKSVYRTQNGSAS